MLNTSEKYTNFFQTEDALHREDGPAVECKEGIKYTYWKSGVVLTEACPKYITVNNDESFWWLNGKFFATEQRFIQQKLLNLLS